ncbi:LysR family transcriptional regulator [Terrihabitans sp. B22-R8]|uniref:LysR family transcriptional regulator n=1 Tax=Terrihabitans sp. B22-R8 TaxID=3425128 RepID=UPI00403C3AE8
MKFDSRLLSGISVLSAVVEAGSFVRAGAALGLTQSAISRSVARLEERIGLRVFHRNARAVRLTDEGRRFFEEVLPLLSQIEEAAIRAGGATAAIRGKLKISTDAAFGHHVLAPRIGGFLDAHPDLSVEILVREGVGDLLADGFDVGVHFGPPETALSGCRLLLETRVLTCASPDYISRYGAPQKPQDVESDKHHCILMRDPTTGRSYGWEFKRGKKIVAVRPNGRLSVNDTGGLLGACIGGHGIAQPLELYSRPYIRSGAMIEVLTEWSEERFPLYAYYKSPTLLSAKVQAFLRYVEDILAETAVNIQKQD